MVSDVTFRESRRSTRVPLKVVIIIEGGVESRTCEGETIVVNLHGALISTAIELSRGMRISIRVYLTDKRAAARVVYVDPENPLHCGIELAEPQNIWGVSLPPDDWEETGAFEIRIRTVNVPASRTYDIKAGTEKITTRGIFQLSVDVLTLARRRTNTALMATACSQSMILAT
jgi:hypothetical protein